MCRDRSNLSHVFQTQSSTSTKWGRMLLLNIFLHSACYIFVTDIIDKGKLIYDLVYEILHLNNERMSYL